jgi:hypothetical protein
VFMSLSPPGGQARWCSIHEDGESGHTASGG